MPVLQLLYRDAGDGWFWLLLPLFLLVLPSRAQTQFTRIYGTVDSGVAVPQSTGMLGRVDPAALLEVQNHLKAVGSIPWTDMQATGSMTLPGGQSAGAVLSVLQGQNFRLDVTAGNATSSMRIAWRAGAAQMLDGSVVYIPEATAALGLMAFPRLRVENFAGSNFSLIDYGMATVGGTLLHRISFEYPLNGPESAAASSSPAAAVPLQTVAVDLYFDPNSHLLMKSADLVAISGMGDERFLRCLTYGDYQEVNGSLIPYQYSQSLNGQVQWSLQLTQVNLGVGLQESAFIF